MDDRLSVNSTHPSLVPDNAPENPLAFEQIAGLILAGGRSRRLGGQDKGLIELSGRAMIEYVLAALRPRLGELLISANHNRIRYAHFGLPVLPDDAYIAKLGPLAGMATGLYHAKRPYLITAPCDAPALQASFLERMVAAWARSHGAPCVAHDGERLQPVFALLSKDHLASLQHYLASGHRRADGWLASLNSLPVDFSDQPALFGNINTPTDLHRFRQHYAHAASN